MSDANTTHVIADPVRSAPPRDFEPAILPPNLVSASTDHRSNNIDAIRITLSFLVLFSHSYPLALGHEDTEPLNWFSRGQMTLGALAVDCFFILSGYLITQSWERSRTAWSFVKKRVARIYPGLIVATAIGVWVVVPLASDHGREVFTWSMLKFYFWRIVAFTQLPVPPVFVDNPTSGVLNGSLWSIKAELLCYVGVMVLGVTRFLKHPRWVLALLILCIGISFGFAFMNYRPGGKILGTIFGPPRIWARLLPYYLAGVVAYLYRSSYTITRKGMWISVVGLLVAARIPHGLLFAMPTLGTYLLLYLSFTRDWTWHNAAAHGDFSYGVYLYAYPIQQLIMHAIGHPTSPWLLFLLAAPPSLAAGYLSWHLVESRFLKKVPQAPPSAITAATMPSPP